MDIKDSQQCLSVSGALCSCAVRREGVPTPSFTTRCSFVGDFFILWIESFQSCTKTDPVNLTFQRASYVGNSFPHLPLFWHNYCNAEPHDDRMSRHTLTDFNSFPPGLDHTSCRCCPLVTDKNVLLTHWALYSFEYS